MPREPIPFVRAGGFLQAEKMFVLSYEGAKSEKKYFDDFRHSKWFNNNGLIEIIPLKRPENVGSDPISVRNLLKKAKDDFRFKSTDEFWLIIDRDNWEDIHNHDFNQLARDCEKEKNFYLAMSNPCFELWLLLHLMSFDELDDTQKQKLLENKKVNKSKNYIDQLLGELQGQGYNKRPNPKIYLPKTRIALERAKQIDQLNEAYPKTLGTHVYRLIDKLIVPENQN